MQIARERALKNSRTGTLPDGTAYAVSEGPEFTNMTHDALHEHNPDADVTIVVSLKFNPEEEDQVAHSVRSWVSKVDAAKLVGTHGGGSARAAGGRQSIDVKIDALGAN